MAFKHIPLLNIQDCKDIDLKFKSDIIKWLGTDEDEAELDSVIHDVDLDKLKKMLLGGAPYLHKKGDDSPMSISALCSRDDIMSTILQRHEKEGTTKNRKLFLEQAHTALTNACLTNNTNIVRSLLTAGALVTPEIHVIQAAENGSTAVLEEMLTFLPDIDIHTTDGYGNTPLHTAVRNNHVYTVMYLLSKNANPNAVNCDEYTTVHMACCYAGKATLRILLQRGGDVNVREKKGKTAVMIAAEIGREDCIHILAAAGANLDQRDNERNVPLITAASLGHKDTMRELILNGASIRVCDNQRYNAFERAVMNKRDGTAAVIIRLATPADSLQNYLQSISTSLLESGQNQLTETMKALLDRLVVQARPQDEICVHTGYLEIDRCGRIPTDTEYESNNTFLLQRIARSGNEEIACHGTVRLLVDKKMKMFGNNFLGVELFFYLLFLSALLYSLTVASYRPIPLSLYTSDVISVSRVFTEIVVLVYYIVDLVTEGVKIYQLAKLSCIDKLNKNISTSKNKRRIDKLSNSVCARTLITYFSDKYNCLDALGLLTLSFLILLRVTTQPTQWIFATLTFLINGVRIFKLIAVLPGIGPYTHVVYRITIEELSLFSGLFFLTLCIFTGGYFVSLRTPHSVSGFANASLNADTDRTGGVDDGVEWVFLSGLRVLLEGNIYEGQYLFRELNWLAASLYLAFLFLIVVVYVNVFIAQLANSYGSVKKSTEKTFAWQRLHFITQVERAMCCKKDYSPKETVIDSNQLLSYYGVSCVSNLSCFKEELDVNEMLASIEKKQSVSTQSHEVSKSHVTEYQAPSLSPLPQKQLLQREDSEEIRKTSDIIDQLLNEIRLKDALLLERNITPQNEVLIDSST